MELQKYAKNDSLSSFPDKTIAEEEARKAKEMMEDYNEMFGFEGFGELEEQDAGTGWFVSPKIDWFKMYADDYF